MIKSNTVAAERRMDLASLFCMIGRHGPAVALAVVALVSVLAGFIIYRTVRGKRRKATAAADDGGAPSGGEESDEAVIHPEESTDLSDEGLSDAKEAADLIKSDLKVRHRRAAAADDDNEGKPPRYSPPESLVQAPDHHKLTTTADDTEEKPVAWDSYTETLAEEAAQHLQSDTCSVDHVGEEDAVDDCGGATEDVTEDVIEEAHDNDSWLKEPELMHEYHHEQEEKVMQEGCQEDVTTDEDVSDQIRPEEETFDMIQSDDDGGFQDNNPTLETNVMESDWKEPDNHIEDEPAPCVCDGKGGESEEENPDVADYRDYPSSNGLSQVEEKKAEVDEEVERVDYQQTAQQVETLKVEEEINLPSLEQNQCEDVLDEVTQDGDLDEDLAGEVIEELETPTQLNKKEVEIELNEENDCLCNQEETFPYDSAEPTEEEVQIIGNGVCSEESERSNVEPEHNLSRPHDNDLSEITTETQVLGAANIPADCQEPQREDEICSYLDGEAGFTVVETINNDLNQATVAADPDPAEHPTDYVIVEEISCPLVPSTYQDQQSDPMNNPHTFDEIRVNSVPDTQVCDHAIVASPWMSEETSHPDMFLSQDHESDHTMNDLPEVVTSHTSPPTYQMHFPSFEQSERRDNDIISPSVGEESGISSMAVSPDLQDAGREFDAMVENMIPPVIDNDLPCAAQMATRHSPFADDVAVSVNEDAAGAMEFGSHPSGPSQQPNNEKVDWTFLESFAANEDVFGHEVEDSYHKALDQLADQMAASAMSFTDELVKQTEMKVVDEVVAITEKKAGVSVEVKKKAKGEKEEEEEEEEEYEKTEISIMEATMDYNEWITDSNCQTLPWMNLSTPSFSQDQTKNTQPPTDECSAAADVTSEDAQDVPPPPEVKQAGAPSSPLDENYKKVVAVQPMPQNVNVTFSVHYFTHSPYQTVAVTGNQQELGNWKGFVPLERAKDGHWTTVVSLPAESHVEWKFVVVDKGEVCRWEECGNRLLDTGYGDDLLVHKWWGLL